MAGEKHVATIRVFKDGALVGTGKWFDDLENGTFELEWYDEDVQDAFQKILETEWKPSYTPIQDGQADHPPKNIVNFEIMLGALGLQMSLDIREIDAI